MSKSHVGLGYAVCPVCGKRHDETVLLQRAIGAPPKLDHENFTGWEMCPEHQRMKDDGYIALVGCNNEPTGSGHDKLRTADRTGEIAHVRASVWSHIFNVPAPAQGMAFVPPEVIRLLERIPQEG